MLFFSRTFDRSHRRRVFDENLRTRSWSGCSSFERSTGNRHCGSRWRWRWWRQQEIIFLKTKKNKTMIVTVDQKEVCTCAYIRLFLGRIFEKKKMQNNSTPRRNMDAGVTLHEEWSCCWKCEKPTQTSSNGLHVNGDNSTIQQQTKSSKSNREIKRNIIHRWLFSCLAFLSRTSQQSKRLWMFNPIPDPSAQLPLKPRPPPPLSSLHRRPSNNVNRQLLLINQLAMTTTRTTKTNHCQSWERKKLVVRGTAAAVPSNLLFTK